MPCPTLRPAVVAGALLIAEILFPSRSAVAMDVVRGGKPVAVVVVKADESAPEAAKGGKRRGKKRAPQGDEAAAAVLVEWVQKMTGAELQVEAIAVRGEPAIYVGRAACDAGLKLDDIRSESQEGLRIRCDGRRLLLAGQNDTATLKAVCRLLEEWGCRFFIDHPLGEVYPQTRDLSVGRLEITDKPGFLYRSIWGSQWSGSTLWKTWNGAGGTPLSTGHAWRQYVAQDLFGEHPEYFHMIDGQRQPSSWYCTSNPALRKLFAGGVMESVRKGATNPSISPPDGRGYCQCEACCRQDDPKSIEPSSGHVCVTNRYVDFYQYVAGRLAKASPESVLSFYCYADYTQAPTSGIKLHPNLCAWIAPIRYCRFHRIGDPNCPSRAQLAELIDGWNAAAEKIAYRTYNYNLAECCLPVSLASVWKHDIPYLKRKGCIGLNLETLTNWQIYAPHIYLSIRLAYDPEADAEAILDDFYQRFYGPKAAVAMKEYWTAVDRAVAEMPCHAGSFHALHLVYTAEFLRRCRTLIDRAAAAATGNVTYEARVAAADEGLRNAEQYIAVRDALNRGDGAAAARVYAELLNRSEANRDSKLGNHYTVNYLKRFVGPYVEAAAAVTSRPNKLLAVLPDRWRLAYDEADEGLALGFAKKSFDESAWREVATYSNPLDAQGLPDRQTIMWYRVRFDLPQEKGPLALMFLDVDGDATVYVNGHEVGGSEKKRWPFAVDISRVAQQGDNTVAVRVDHRNITELFLGGILRPVLLVHRGE